MATSARFDRFVRLRGCSHGVFHKTNQKEIRNAKFTYEWLRTGCQRSETEALIVAAQDGAIMTRAYMVRVLKIPVSVLCRCQKMP